MINILQLHGMLPGSPLRPAGDLNSHWFRGFKQCAELHLVIMVLNVYLIRFK